MPDGYLPRSAVVRERILESPTICTLRLAFDAAGEPAIAYRVSRTPDQVSVARRDATGWRVEPPRSSCA